jgi:hypothetical protein
MIYALQVFVNLSSYGLWGWDFRYPQERDRVRNFNQKEKRNQFQPWTNLILLALIFVIEIRIKHKTCSATLMDAGWTSRGVAHIFAEIPGGTVFQDKIARGVPVLGLLFAFLILRFFKKLAWGWVGLLFHLPVIICLTTKIFSNETFSKTKYYSVFSVDLP